MKKPFAVFLCILITTLTSFAQNPVPAHFDECVELMAAVWRLSGADEYSRCMVPQYAHEVDSVFAPFKEHPVVQLARQYPNETGIGYDAVASYGLHLTVTKDGTIVFNDSFLEGSDDSFDRWSEKQLKELAKLDATYKVNLKDGAKDVPSGIFTLVIKFSKPMVDGIALYNSFSGADFPPFKSYAWPDDRTLDVTFYLEPFHRYGFTVLGSSFTTKDGHSAGETREFNFTTGNKN